MRVLAGLKTTTTKELTNIKVSTYRITHGHALYVSYTPIHTTVATTSREVQERDRIHPRWLLSARIPITCYPLASMPQAHFFTALTLTSPASPATPPWPPLPQRRASAPAPAQAPQRMGMLGSRRHPPSEAGTPPPEVPPPEAPPPAPSPRSSRVLTGGRSTSRAGPCPGCPVRRTGCRARCAAAPPPPRRAGAGRGRALIYSPNLQLYFTALIYSSNLQL